MKNHWNMELIVSLSAMFIGISAFLVSMYQARQMSKQTEILLEQQHASVWPRLFSYRNTGTNENGPTYAIGLDNRGLGPAQIKYVEVLIDGKPVKNWNDAYAQMGGEGVFLRSKASLPNLIMKPAESINVLQVSGEIAKPFLSHEIDLITCYCSLYERCWILDESTISKGFPLPVPVAACPSNDDRQFLD